MQCPICNTESNNTSKCNNCEWEFIFFTNDPTQKELEIINKKMSLYCKEIVKNFISNNRFEESVPYAMKGLSLQDDEELYLITSEILLNHLGNYTLALELHLIQLDVFPSPKVKMMIGICYFHTGDYDNALKYSQETISEDDTLPIHDIIGSSYYIQKKYDKALIHFEKHLLVDPNNTDIINLVNEIMNISKQKKKSLKKDKLSTGILIENPISLEYAMFNRGEFETVDEFMKRLLSYKYLIVGKIKFLDYAVDYSQYKIEIIFDPLLEYYKNLTLTLNMDRDTAKSLKNKANKNSEITLYSDGFSSRFSDYNSEYEEEKFILKNLFFENYTINWINVIFYCNNYYELYSNYDTHDENTTVYKLKKMIKEIEDIIDENTTFFTKNKLAKKKEKEKQYLIKYLSTLLEYPNIKKRI